MKRIAVLGPKGTYSDIACKKYIGEMNLSCEVDYYPSIFKAAEAVKEDTIAILPFENTLDGFVMESMDRIIDRNLHILSQVKLDIDFAFVSNAKSIDEVKNCYVQYKAYGQCLDFISKYGFNIYTTQSNMESMERVIASNPSFGAVVPIHALAEQQFALEICHIADSPSNETRFFVVADSPVEEYRKEALEASVVITSVVDRPGILFDILKNFHDLDINLKSIMSRPMKTEMGKYRFYLECSLLNEQRDRLDSLIRRFSQQKEFIVRILGIYNKVR